VLADQIIVPRIDKLPVILRIWPCSGETQGEGGARGPRRWRCRCAAGNGQSRGRENRIESRRAIEGGDRAIAREENNEAKWLVSQFQQVCLSLLERPYVRRGPFSIGDDVLRAATTKDRKPDFSKLSRSIGTESRSRAGLPAFVVRKRSSSGLQCWSFDRG
jgi:hypothetical protein